MDFFLLQPRQVPVVQTHGQAEGTKVYIYPRAAPDRRGDRWKEVFWERRDSGTGFVWRGRTNVYQFIMLSAIALRRR